MAPELVVERRPDFRRGSCQVGAKPVLQLPILHSQFLLRRFPFQLELACAAVATIMRETKEVESARGTFAQAGGSQLGESPESDQLRLFLG